MPFQPGQSGNPGGRQPGSRNKKTLALQKLMNERSEETVKRAFDMADSGDRMMLRVMVERILPKATHSPLVFDLPPMQTSADARAAMGSIVQGVSDGELTPNEGAELGKLVRAASLVTAETNHEERIKKLEEIAAENEKSK